MPPHLHIQQAALELAKRRETETTSVHPNGFVRNFVTNGIAPAGHGLNGIDARTCTVIQLWGEAFEPTPVEGCDEVARCTIVQTMTLETIQKIWRI